MAGDSQGEERVCDGVGGGQAWGSGPPGIARQPARQSLLGPTARIPSSLPPPPQARRNHSTPRHCSCAPWRSPRA